MLIIQPSPSRRSSVSVAATGNWLERSAGVRWRSVAFNTEADRGSEDTINGSVYSHAWYNTGPTNSPYLDLSMTCEGNGSLRFEIPGAQGPSGTHASVGGVWYANFDPTMNRANYCDENINNVVYVQWRQRFNQAWIDTTLLDFNQNTQAGVKYVDLIPGDIAIPSVKAHAFTSGRMKLVMQTFYNLQFPWLYKYRVSDMATIALQDNTGGEIAYQNSRPSPFCHYPEWTNCFTNVADQWLTFQLMFNTGGVFSAPNTWPNAAVKMWAAFEGGTQELIHDYHPGHAGHTGHFGRDSGNYSPAADQIGKINIFPYVTNMDETQEHDTLMTWGANVIIDDQFIADPTTA